MTVFKRDNYCDWCEKMGPRAGHEVSTSASSNCHWSCRISLSFAVSSSIFTLTSSSLPLRALIMATCLATSSFEISPYGPSESMVAFISSKVCSSRSVEGCLEGMLCRQSLMTWTSGWCCLPLRIVCSKVSKYWARRSTSVHPVNLPGFPGSG